MKIALVHKQFTLQGGTERYLVGLACFLAEREHEVHIFCSHVDPVLSGIRGLHLHKIRTFGLGGFLKALMFWLMVRLKVRPGEYDIVHGFGRTTDHDVVRAGGGCHRAYLNILQDRAAEGMARFRLAIDLRHRFNLWVEGRQLTGGHTARFIGVELRRAAGLDMAKSARPRAHVTENHDGGRAPPPAFAHVRAFGRLAHRMQAVLVDNRPQVLVCLAPRQSRSQPRWLGSPRVIMGHVTENAIGQRYHVTSVCSGVFCRYDG